MEHFLLLIKTDKKVNNSSSTRFPASYNPDGLLAKKYPWKLTFILALLSMFLYNSNGLMVIPKDN